MVQFAALISISWYALKKMLVSAMDIYEKYSKTVDYCTSASTVHHYLQQQ